MSVTRESPYEYFLRPDVVSEYASFEFLLEPEKTILNELRPRLGQARMLDIGVGAGRTTMHFAPLVREYVGIDVSPAMIEACRKRLSQDSPAASFEVADVRDLRDFEDSSFDVVLFSFNGIDTVGGKADRLAALDEIHRVCRPGASFCFSSSNILYARACSSLPASIAMWLHSPYRRRLLQPSKLRRVLAEARRWKRLNPAIRAYAARGEGMIVEERPRFEYSEKFYSRPRERIRVEKYYIEPREQLAQLAAAGFGAARIFLPDGHEIDEGAPAVRRSWWLYYLCRNAV
jgi:ubiquinone/menaquinone biosynthesis C-methylase UbiE